MSSPKPRPNLRFVVKSPQGIEIKSPANGWRWKQETLLEKIESGEIIFSNDGSRLIKKTYLKNQKGLSPSTLWDNIEETGHNRQAKYELKKLFPEIQTSDLFSTPKPEKLLHRILTIATNPGDLVLDSFAGSGTTGAVAQKMGRRWIMVELGEHCHTHIIPRLQKVIDGTDQGGISKAVNWKGGGGFRYYRLAPSLIVKDKYNMPIINKEYNAEMLAEAMCKHMGFTYAPNPQFFWMHGQSSETDYIFVTTQKFTHDALRLISEEVGDRRTLLICCPAWSANVDAFPNLTLTKIPQSVLNRCEWGKDDYSLNVANLPMMEETEDANPKQPSLLEKLDA